MKVVFLSNFALDANVSLVKELDQACDVYFVTEALHKLYNYLDKKKLSKTITLGSEVEELQRFSSFLQLNKTYVIRGVPNRSFLKKIFISYRTHTLVKRIKPDIIVIDSLWGLSYIFTVLSCRNRTLSIIHDPFPHSGEGGIVSQIFRNLFLKLIPNKLLLNASQRERFVEVNKLDMNKTYLSFLSVYTYLTCFTPEKIEANGKFNLLFFGRISPYKGVKYLLDAFVNIIHDPILCNNLSLTVAGSGEFDFDTSLYEKYSNVTFINRFIEPQELAGLVQNSSVVVCPYIDATQSGVVMSAFAFKKPVIATNTGGLPEMVEHYKTGLIVEPKDISELEAAILTLYNNPDLLKIMRDNIEKEYFNEGVKSWHIAASHIINAIEKISSNEK